MSELLLIGLSHHTTPVHLREQVHLGDYQLDDMLTQLKALPQVEESVILSTCNRLEIYIVSQHPPLDVFDAVQRFFSGVNLYLTQGEAAIYHLFRVATGLDSMILGETQILGQVTQALKIAQGNHTAGAYLNRLFMSASKIGKRARSETGISHNTMSISQAAVKFLDGQTSVLVIGAGSMGRKAITALQQIGVKRIILMNRTFSRAEAIANQLHITAAPWDQLTDILSQVDAVIAATSTQQAIITPEMLNHPITLIDIGVPRNIHPSVDNLPHVTRFDIDHIRHVIDTSLAQRQQYIPAVEAMIKDEATAYQTWLAERAVVPTITALRNHITDIINAEFQQTINNLNDLQPEEIQALSRMMHKVINKVLHQPTTTLNQSAITESREMILDAVQALFSLETT